MTHSTMDKGKREPRPHCKTHNKTFRNWGGAYGHKGTHKGCVLITIYVNTR